MKHTCFPQERAGYIHMEFCILNGPKESKTETEQEVLEQNTLQQNVAILPWAVKITMEMDTFFRAQCLILSFGY